MISWLISGGFILALFAAIWWQNHEIQSLEEDIGQLHAQILLKEAALEQNKNALIACKDINQQNQAEAEEQKQAALEASRNVAVLRNELSAAMENVSRGTERFTDEILTTKYSDDFVSWLRDG